MLKIHALSDDGYVLIDTAMNEVFQPLFKSHDTASVFKSYLERFSEVPNEQELASAIESFLSGLDELGVSSTPEQKLEAFLHTSYLSRWLTATQGKTDSVGECR